VIGPPSYPPLPIETTRPWAVLEEPTPAEARRVTRDLLAAAGIDGEDADGLVAAVSELVTNARAHGLPPVDVRGWVADDAVVVTVTDSGPGPSTNTSHVAPEVRAPGEGGFGLLIAYQLSAELVSGRSEHGFTARVVARRGGIAS